MSITKHIRIYCNVMQFVEMSDLAMFSCVIQIRDYYMLARYSYENM